MQIFDAKVMKDPKMLIVHCCKHSEKNTYNGFAVSFLPLFYRH
jgi:hypothetical protein